VPRWIVPLVVLSDVVVLGVLYAVLGPPGLLFGVPVLIGTVIALLVLRLVTAPHRRLLADLRAGAGQALGSGASGAARPGPYRHGSPGGADDPWWWPTDDPRGSRDDSWDDSWDGFCDDRGHPHGRDHACGGSWTADDGGSGPEPTWSGSDSGWSSADSSSGPSSDSSSSSSWSSDSGSSSSSSSDSGSSSGSSSSD
jgi:hypothetical protein